MDATARGMVGLLPPPANIHVAAHAFFHCDTGVLQWLNHCLYALGYTTDAARPPQQRISILTHERAPAWIAEKVPYIAVATEQPRHKTFASQSNKLWLTHAAGVWCMDTTDMDFIHTLYRVPLSRMCVLPCMLATFLDGVPCTIAAAPTAIVHLGSINPYRHGILDEIQRRLAARRPASAVQLHAFDALYDEPARSRALHGARVLVIPNFYAPPCVMTWHRIAYALHVRHPQLRIVAETCEGSAVSAKLLAALAPLVRTCAGHALAAHAVAAAHEEPWPAEVVREHAAQLQHVFGHILTPPRNGVTWLW
jgi:hypothetical protein